MSWYLLKKIIKNEVLMYIDSLIDGIISFLYYLYIKNVKHKGFCFWGYSISNDLIS